MKIYKTQSDFFNKAANQAGGDMEEYYRILGESYPGRYPTEMGAAATEAAIRSGYSNPSMNQRGGTLYQSLTNRR